MGQEVSTNAANTAAERSLKGSHKSTRVINKFDAILKRARNLYAMNWQDKGIKAKRASLDRAVEEGKTNTYSPDKFKMDFAHRINSLLDSKLFCEKCHNKGLDPYNAATHIVMMEGRKGIESLLIERKYEGEDSKFQPYAEWSEPIIPRNDLNLYLDKETALLTNGKSSLD